MNRAHAFIDESESGTVMTFAATIIPDEQLAAFNAEFLSLSRAMRQEMIELNYPIARDPNFASRELKIHGKEMWNGTDQFATERPPKGVQDFSAFHRHIKWMAKLLTLIPKYGLWARVVHVKNKADLTKNFEARNTNIFVIVQDTLPENIDLEKANSYQFDESIQMLFTLLSTLHIDLEVRDLAVTVTCDQGKRNQVMKLVGAYSLARAHGYWPRLDQPDFADSGRYPGLQIADLVAYLFTKFIATPFDHRHRGISDALFKSRINPYLTTVRHFQPRQDNLPENSALLGAMLVEMMFMHSGGPQQEKALREEAAQPFILDILGLE